MDRQLINQKLESLRRCHQRILDKTPQTPEALVGDADLQDILTLNLTRAIQLCVDIGSHLISDLDATPPATMGETFDVLADAGAITMELAERLKKAVGFRNIAVHNYEKIDWTIVHVLASSRLDDFRDYAAAIEAQTRNVGS